MASFQDALRTRLSAIDERGVSQTTWDRLTNARKRDAELQKQKLDWQKSITNRMRIAGEQAAALPGYITNTLSTGPSGNNAFDQFVSKIAGKESGGNYSARNAQSGALGKYQIMPSNIPSWSKQALGYSVSADQFLKSPQIQEQVARHKLQEYYKQYGPAGASIAWYAGPGAAQKYVSSGQVSTKREAGGYPSVAEYMRSITGR